MHIKLLNLIVSLGLIFNFLGGNPEPDQPTGALHTNRLDLIPTWTTGIIGNGVGPARILATDLNQDGKVDVATCSNGHAYVVNMQPGYTYRTAWFSEDIDCIRIAHADRDFNGIQELYISTANGRVIIIDSATYSVVGTLTMPDKANDFDVADVDGDGAIEIVAVVTNGAFVYNATTFLLEWQANGFGGNSVEIGNIDADPLPEIVVNGSTGYVLNAGERKNEWAYSGGFGSNLSLGDVDGDGRDEIAYIAGWENAYVLDGDTRTIKWQLGNLGDLSVVSAVDVNADGTAEVIIGNGQWGSITGYQGSDGTKLWSIPNPEHGVSGIGVGDADNDGVNEILWGAGHDSSLMDVLIIGSWASQTLEWMTPDLEGPLTIDSGDIDLDGQMEIVMASTSTNNKYQGGMVCVYDAVTHSLEWSTVIADSYFKIHQLAIGQLDLDPALEILVGGDKWYNTHLLVYDGVTRALEWESPEMGSGAPGALLVRNIDEDPVDEIIIGLSTGHVQVLNGSSPVIQWDSGRLDTAIIDLAVGDLGTNENLNLAVLSANGLYLYDASTWELIGQRVVESGNQIAMINADFNEPGQLQLITSSDMVYTLQALAAKSLELDWQRSLGSVLVKDLAVADLDADAIQELIIVGSTTNDSSSPSLLMIGTRSHPLFWKYSMKGNWGQIKNIDISDVDQDGQSELLTGNSSLIQVNEIVATEEVFQQTYLSIVSKPHPPRGLYGKVTFQGAPAGQVSLLLMVFSGISWFSVAHVQTASDGSYAFTGIPNLDPGQAYYVRFQNNQYGDPDKLWTWRTRVITSYSNGDDINIGNFDLANIPLVNPIDQTVVSLPFTFQWGVRTATPSDSYELNLFDPDDGDPYFYNNPPLGYVNHFVLGGLPTGFKVNTPYVWDVWVYGPDGGLGVSYEAYWVVFSNAGASVTTAERPSHPKILPDMDVLR